jgi:hypothetical protein
MQVHYLAQNVHLCTSPVTANLRCPAAIRTFVRCIAPGHDVIKTETCEQKTGSECGGAFIVIDIDVMQQYISQPESFEIINAIPFSLGYAKRQAEDDVYRLLDELSPQLTDPQRRLLGELRLAAETLGSLRSGAEIVTRLR